MKFKTYPWCCFWITVVFAIAIKSALAAGVNGVELGSRPTPDQLKQGLGISILAHSESAAQLAAELSGARTPPKRSPALGLPIASGSYTGFMAFAGMSVQTFVVIDELGAVQMITVSFDPQAYFDRFESIMREKYGKPTDEGRLDQATAAGLHVQNIELDWDLPDHSTVSLLKYATTITRGQLKIESEAHKKTWAGLYSKSAPVPR